MSFSSCYSHSMSPEDKLYFLFGDPLTSPVAVQLFFFFFCLLRKCIQCTDMKFGTYIHAAQRINHNDFGDHLTLYVGPPAS